jgi:rhodanese-related sulfurtransferase
MASYKEIDSTTLNALVSAEPVTLVDVRTDDETARGIIPGALHIPLHLLPLKIDELEGNNPLVFYCHSGIRSAQACNYMASQGRENNFNLRGGVIGWDAAGYALVPKS